MKYLSSICFAIVFVVFAFSCDTAASRQKKEEDLAKEVIAVHDEVMPQMETIFKLRQRLKKGANLLMADSLNLDKAALNETEKVIADLDSADHAMMDWMHTYNGGQDLYSHDEKMAYLKAEMTKISNIKETTLKSIEEAEKWIAQNPKIFAK